MLTGTTTSTTWNEANTHMKNRKFFIHFPHPSKFMFKLWYEHVSLILKLPDRHVLYSLLEVFKLCCLFKINVILILENKSFF